MQVRGWCSRRQGGSAPKDVPSNHPPWDRVRGSGHEKAQAKKRLFQLGHRAESTLKAVEANSHWG